ncbi:MAG TPA: hypothetical protein VF360_08130 [Candidatus Methanoperedens sp.]
MPEEDHRNEHNIHLVKPGSTITRKTTIIRRRRKGDLKPELLTKYRISNLEVETPTTSSITLSMLILLIFAVIDKTQ